MNEKVEAAAKRLAANRAWRQESRPWNNLDPQQQDYLREDAQVVLEAAAALPPLREEIADTLDEIARACEERAHPGGSLLISHAHLEDMRAIAEKARTALSSTAGQEWRDISTAPKLPGDENEIVALWLDDRGDLIQVFVHYDASNDPAVLGRGRGHNHGFIGRCGNIYGAGGLTHWRPKFPLPAPPVAEPPVAYCVFCKTEHSGGATCMGHHP